eukprot:TRINITY_DN23700_c0_g1_i1.p1 TRINITY_DN23700_c0_g1~~TRINITY_DN23700_c0_g1_i1.p1  ORF type:complete len:641 (-),score=121.08 TRINITY_DN23700_c0_g1_i1:987-2909(-)
MMAPMLSHLTILLSACGLLWSARKAAGQYIGDGYPLFLLASSFEAQDHFVNNIWQSGDPCDGWQYITCSSDRKVTILDMTNAGAGGIVNENIGQLTSLTTLSLAGNGFFGDLPDALFTLPSLMELDLSNNTFYGPIPPGLANLTMLKERIGLNLANNSFTGAIPTSLERKFCYPRFEGNPGILTTISANFPNCTAPVAMAPPSSSENLAAIIGGSVGGALALLLIIGAVLGYYFVYVYNVRKGPGFVRLSTEELERIEAGLQGSLEHLPRFKEEELSAGTNGFSDSNKLGEGGSAIVYKCVLKKGTNEETTVAVKRFKEDDVVGVKEMEAFLQEVNVISRAVHRHVLPVKGFCIDNGERMLVFPYMPNMSVADHLQVHRKSDRNLRPLDLRTRLRIAVQVAEGLAYLHDSCQPCIIHRDIKAQNILLDDRNNALVADFGLARLWEGEDTHMTTHIRGTYGHLAPEVVVSGHVSDKTDVYSYGIFLLELLTGLDGATLAEKEDQQQGFENWVLNAIDEKRIVEIADVELRLMDLQLKGEGEYDDEGGLSALVSMAKLAVFCLNESPSKRPGMSECSQLLQEDKMEKAWVLWLKHTQGQAGYQTTTDSASTGTGGVSGAGYSGGGSMNTDNMSQVGFQLPAR